MNIRKRTSFGKDKRRKHHHWKVTLYYGDGDTFARVYTDHDKAARFAKKQKKFPAVKMIRVVRVS
jgi:hypothetical protein